MRMAGLSGLILAGACSDEDDLVGRLHGRSRYAMPLANRALVRYAADAMVASGVEKVAIAVAPSTIADVCEVIGDGSGFGAHFRYLQAGSADTALATIVAGLEVVGTERPVLVHSGDGLVAAGLADAIAEFDRTRPDVMMVTGRSPSCPAAPVAGARGAGARIEGFFGLDNVLEGNRMILDELPHHPIEVDLKSVRIEGRVAIDPSTHMERTTIRGPAVIGRCAELTDTFIGPYTSVGPNARLGGAEIDHSIVLPGASIRHPGTGSRQA
jgi:glucose-1-phosphate thymidylyltransferase